MVSGVAPELVILLPPLVHVHGMKFVGKLGECVIGTLSGYLRKPHRSNQETRRQWVLQGVGTDHCVTLC